MGLPNPGIAPASSALQADYLPTELSGKPIVGRFYDKLRENFSNLNCSEWCGLLQETGCFKEIKTRSQINLSRMLLEVFKCCNLMDHKVPLTLILQLSHERYSPRDFTIFAEYCSVISKMWA